MIRYAITSGGFAAGVGRRWAAGSVDFVQLRDKEFDSGALAGRARELLQELRETEIKLLIHRRVDVALAVGAAGVHLTAVNGELTPAQVRTLLPAAVLSVSCHTGDEVRRAVDAGVDWILFAPVFEKRVNGQVVVPGAGISALRDACAAAPGRVLALGGVTAANSAACIEAGATGVAGIRLFA